ncbi:MAG TPA: TonB-dependent receptor [Holophaga sp.]|nr:TonB-dependent receptor [Holophaga sp.]
MMRTTSNLGRVSALLIAGSAFLAAQGTQTASSTGQVVTTAGVPVAGAKVYFNSPALMGTRTIVTDAKGAFVARLLPPGLYTITVVKDGFQTVKVTEKIGIDQNYQPRITLSEVQSAIVQVVATATAVDKTDVKTATNYALEEVDKLPTLNRTMETVALLTPGVVEGVGGRVQIRGAMTSGNLYMVDGQNVSDNSYGNRGSRIIEDSIEETQVITGAISAEYGNVDGGVINSITRSGSNEFTGQLRWELSSPKWNALRPMQDATAVANNINQTRTFSAGGPILKDRLWFFTSYFTTNSHRAEAIDSDALGAGTNYDYGIKEIRRQLKLTFQATPDHQVVLAYNNSQNSEQNRDYSAGELAALVPQRYNDEFWNLSVRSIWTSALTTDVRYGEKKQKFTGGGVGNQSPLYSDDDTYFYNQGIFNSQDGGDNRNNKTFSAKASLFVDMLGTHQIDAGFDYYEGIHQARNEQSPTNMIYEVSGVDYQARTATPVAIWMYNSVDGKARNLSKGLYVNDKWSLNKYLSFQVGLRWDKYEAKNEGNQSTASANGFSPRLGLKYDLYGDSKWVFGASWARYNGKVLESITNSVTSQGNPTETDWVVKDANNALVLPFEQIQDPSLYRVNDFSGGAVSYYNNPTSNVRLNKDMTPPRVTEWQVSAAYSYAQNWGSGFVRLTAVKKDWSNIIDYTIGTMGLSDLDITGSRYYMKIWGNQPDATRKYRDLEFDASWSKGNWSATGNITWASLKGNYEGEGDSTPGRGEGVNAWNNVTLYDGDYNEADGKSNYHAFDKNWKAPSGYLAGHVPLRIRGTLNYTLPWAYGTTSFGLIYRFDSGSHYSNARNLARPAWTTNADGTVDPNVNPYLPGEAGTYLTQYKDQQRGAGVFNAGAFTDLAISHDLPVFKVQGRDLRAFVKIVATNVFNHQQQLSWGKNWATVAYTKANHTSLWTDWTPGNGSGRPGSMTDYANARRVVASAGLRF